GWELKLGDLCAKGSQLRPHIVWFGEMVPMMDTAAMAASQADIFLVVGTSMAVHPAAGLINYVPVVAPKFIVDPKIPDVGQIPNVTTIAENASTGMRRVREFLKKYI